MPAENTQLRLERVSLSAPVGSQYLLKDISFEAVQGDAIALVGSSGAGKTSLLRLLNRLAEPTTGSIYLDNLDYRLLPVIQLRQQIVLVLQESKLLGMTVQQALEYGLILRGLPKQTRTQRLTTWLERLHIPNDWLGRTEVQLSLGQRQLVAIARALVTQPKILLLDEPTSALDIGRASQLLQVLTQLATNTGTTIFMVNHQLELAQLFSTRVLHLQQGQLIQDIPSPQMDWATLRQSLIQAEAQAAEEWS